LHLCVDFEDNFANPEDNLAKKKTNPKDNLVNQKDNLDIPEDNLVNLKTKMKKFSSSQKIIFRQQFSLHPTLVKPFLRFS